MPESLGARFPLAGDAPLSLEKAQALLDGFRELGQQEAHRLPAFERLLLELRPLLVAEALERRRTAARFNIFQELELGTDERLHTLMLGRLLDPRGHHDQGALFLGSFLETFVRLSLQDADLLRTRVVVEQPTGAIGGQKGYIDLCTLLPDGTIVALENKILAAEHSNQIERYLAWIAKESRSTESRLIFLTPSGRRPISGDTPRVRCLSHADLAQWLNDLAPRLPSRLRSVVEQYADLCLWISELAPE